MTTRPKAAEQAADVAALLRARNPLIWIVSREEARVESYLFEAAASAGYVPHTWDVAQGSASMAGKVENRTLADPGAMLTAIDESAREGRTRDVWIMRDLPPWLVGPSGASTCRQLRNLARMLPTVKRDTAQAVIVLSPSGDAELYVLGLDTHR